MDEFRARVLNELTSSREYEMNEKPLLNNIYPLNQTKTVTGFDISVEGNTYMDKLYGIYYKLPTPLKNLIKLIAGRL